MRVREISIAACLLVAAGAARAQMVVEATRLPERFRQFERRPDEATLRCSVKAIPAALNYGFRFQAGYTARVPMEQFRGPGHRWTIVTRVTPEGGAPVFLVSRRRLPEVPKTNVTLEASGGFLLGEGRYRVAWQLVDDAGRVCRADWKIEAKRKRSEREVRVAIAPGAVRSFSGWTVGRDNLKDDAPPFRLTLLVHAASASERVRMGWWDRFLLLGTIGSVLERLPTKSVRVVVFNLDQQREFYRNDDFRPSAFVPLAEAVNSAESGKVDYRVLQRPKGHIDLLAELIQQEVDAPAPSDVVLFLGPHARQVDKMPLELVEPPEEGGPRFVYLQYQPFLRTHAMLPDLIASAVSRLKGRTMVVNTPGDFAKSIAAVERLAVR